ncbi:MAG: DUF3305 domain-containing protein [Roseibium sp.]|nr:DUF3305 domain-containing protein [Roseibium sp.]
MESEIGIPVGVIVERRKSKHPWADYTWTGVAVVPHAPPTDGWQQIMSADDVTQFQYAPVSVTLHRKMGEAYDANMETGAPSLWILLDDADTEPVPFAVRAVTADPYEAQAALDAGEGLIERLPMPKDMLLWAVDYLKQMPDPEAFKKRKRQSSRPEKQQFGKEPIFAQDRRRSEGAGE